MCTSTCLHKISREILTFDFHLVNKIEKDAARHEGSGAEGGGRVLEADVDEANLARHVECCYSSSDRNKLRPTCR